MFRSQSDRIRTLRRWGGVRRLEAYPPAHERSFRTIILLTILVVLNVFDLALTHTQMLRGNFAEANACAAGVATGLGGLVAYKTTLFGLGAAVLYRLRRRWLTEVGLWLLVACFSALMVWWVVYLDTVESCLVDPVIHMSPVRF